MTAAFDDRFGNRCGPGSLASSCRTGRDRVRLSHLVESARADVRRVRIGGATVCGPLATVWRLRGRRVHTAGRELCTPALRAIVGDPVNGLLSVRLGIAGSIGAGIVLWQNADAGMERRRDLRRRQERWRRDD